MNASDRVLKAVLVYQHINGVAPSIREVAELTGLSKSWVHSIVVRLWSQGLIQYTPGKRRSIVLEKL